MSCSAAVLELLDYPTTAVIAVVGCGGKTSLICNLAQACKEKKVLISPTTKIWKMDETDITLCTTLEDCVAHMPRVGIQCLGVDGIQKGKLSALPIDILEQMIPHYDIVLLEADGSRGLPCKGWIETEPVIPNFATHTVGVVTLNGLEQHVDDTTVLRLPEFSKLTGLYKGDIITQDALIDMIFQPEGMFRNAVGHCSLFLNQVDTDYKEEKAIQWLTRVKNMYSHRCDAIVYGVAHGDEWKEM